MRSSNLHARIEALEERNPLNRPSVYVRCISKECEPENVKRAREEEARAAYISEHGEPISGIGVIHNIIVSPRARDGGEHKQ